MGKWAKRLFSKPSFGSVGIVLAGTNTPAFEKEVLGFFDEVISSKDSVYHAHLVRKGKVCYPLVLNVYGASAMVDVLTEMHDGGCRNVIFIGYAYGGFRNLPIGSIVLADISYHFEGIYASVDPSRKIASPDLILQKKIEKLFLQHKISYTHGVNISVPAVTLQPAHANKEYLRIKPTTIEMELSSCYSRSRDIGMRVAGILIISDNRNKSIADVGSEKIRYQAKMHVLKIIIKNLSSFHLTPLEVKKKFMVDKHLASIIADPYDMTNVYKKK